LIRFEKEYNVLRKEEQEEQIEIRVRLFFLLRSFVGLSMIVVFRNYETKIDY